jgi:ATP-binding cassette subfamily C (CFTR/MRP) protein 1
MIYSKTMVLPSTSIGDSAPVTLMSADVERIGAGLRYIHDAWACLVEIPIALYLLWQQLGVASLGPIIVAVCK